MKNRLFLSILIGVFLVGAAIFGLYLWQEILTTNLTASERKILAELEERCRAVGEKSTFRLNAGYWQSLTLTNPFHLYDEKAIRENTRGFYKAFAWVDGFKAHFAV